MSLGEEKCLIKEMEVSKKYLLDVMNTDANIDSVKDYRVPWIKGTYISSLVLDNISFDELHTPVKICSFPL